MAYIGSHAKETSRNSPRQDRPTFIVVDSHIAWGAPTKQENTWHMWRFAGQGRRFYLGAHARPSLGWLAEHQLVLCGFTAMPASRRFAGVSGMLMPKRWMQSGIPSADFCRGGFPILYQPSFFSKASGFPRGLGGFLERRMPGKNGEVSPIILPILPKPSRHTFLDTP